MRETELVLCLLRRVGERVWWSGGTTEYFKGKSEYKEYKGDSSIATALAGKGLASK